MFLLVAAVAGWIARERLHEKPRVLDATRTELRRDVAAAAERAMSSRLVALTARRAALQAECALQRDDAALAYGDIEQGVAKVDRVVAGVRRLAPVLLVGGAVALLAIGPARALPLGAAAASRSACMPARRDQDCCAERSRGFRPRSAPGWW